jgi:hypothetical protein
MHVDFDYLEGSETHCENHSMCCRADSKTPFGKLKTPAGRFGMPASCDLPERTVDDFLILPNSP